MGRPIHKKWFSVKEGSDLGDIRLTTFAGTEVIINQKGTGVYTVASGRVKLVDGAPAAAGEAQITHDGKNVSKINQYTVSYFGGGTAKWRDNQGALVGTFVPALLAEGATTATGTVVMDGAGGDDNGVASVTIVDGGSGYTVAPIVTFSAGTGATATGTAVLTGDAVTSVVVDTDGSYTDVEATGVTVTFSAP